VVVLSLDERDLHLVPMPRAMGRAAALDPARTDQDEQVGPASLCVSLRLQQLFGLFLRLGDRGKRSPQRSTPLCVDAKLDQVHIASMFLVFDTRNTRVSLASREFGAILHKKR